MNFALMGISYEQKYNILINALLRTPFFTNSICYIKFLEADSKIFMPTFDNKVEDDTAQARFEEIFGFGNFIPVPSKEVAMGGGVLNCLTWEMIS